MSDKFGCTLESAKNLLKISKSLFVSVKGVHFHVGSGCGDVSVFVSALQKARLLFDFAKELEMNEFTIVDIGGGFPGSDWYAT